MRRAFGGGLRCLQSQNKARKLHRATNGELRPYVEDLSRQAHELALQGERGYAGHGALVFRIESGK